MAQIFYNGVQTEWDENKFHSSITFRPVKSRAGTQTTAIEYIITMEGWLYDSNNGTDPDMETIRAQVSVNGGELIATGLGWGDDFHVNGNSTTKDCAHGPETLEFSYTPLGGFGNAGRTRWRIKTTIPVCPEIDREGRLMEASWSVTHEIDQDGYTTERVEGQLVISL